MNVNSKVNAATALVSCSEQSNTYTSAGQALPGGLLRSALQQWQQTGMQSKHSKLPCILAVCVNNALLSAWSVPLLCHTAQLIVQLWSSQQTLQQNPKTHIDTAHWMGFCRVTVGSMHAGQTLRLESCSWLSGGASMLLEDVRLLVFALMPFPSPKTLPPVSRMLHMNKSVTRLT